MSACFRYDGNLRIQYVDENRYGGLPQVFGY